MALPEYTDGVLELYRIENDESEDYPEEKLRDTGMRFWYRELAVYDTTRATLSNTSVTGDYDNLILIEGRNKIEITDGFELKVIPNWRRL